MWPSQIDLNTSRLPTLVNMLGMQSFGCWSWFRVEGAMKGVRETFSKSMAVSDRLGTCCQLKYRLEHHEIPLGREQASSWKISTASPSPGDDTVYLNMLRFYTESECRFRVFFLCQDQNIENEDYEMKPYYAWQIIICILCDIDPIL